MKLTNEKEISRWAYEQCKKGNDIIQMRNLITDNYWIYCYCLYKAIEKEKIKGIINKKQNKIINSEKG